MTAMEPERLQRVLDEIDAFNRRDPHQDILDGKEVARELLYSQRLSAWVLQLDPRASDALRIAARGQHIGRWTIPRSAYPMNRPGYLRWREELKRFHAQTVAGLMEKQGCPAELTERVRSIILKKNLKSDPEVQVLEDALCLLFLETQFEDLRRATMDEKMKDIIRKTWQKMSGPGRAAALRMDLPSGQKTLIQEALAG